MIDLSISLFFAFITKWSFLSMVTSEKMILEVFIWWKGWQQLALFKKLLTLTLFEEDDAHFLSGFVLSWKCACLTDYFIPM